MGGFQVSPSNDFDFFTEVVSIHFPSNLLLELDGTTTVTKFAIEALSVYDFPPTAIQFLGIINESPGWTDPQGQPAPPTVNAAATKLLAWSPKSPAASAGKAFLNLALAKKQNPSLVDKNGIMTLRIGISAHRPVNLTIPAASRFIAVANGGFIFYGGGGGPPGSPRPADIFTFGDNYWANTYFDGNNAVGFSIQPLSTDVIQSTVARQVYAAAYNVAIPPPALPIPNPPWLNTVVINGTGYIVDSTSQATIQASCDGINASGGTPGFFWSPFNASVAAQNLTTQDTSCTWGVTAKLYNYGTDQKGNVSISLITSNKIQVGSNPNAQVLKVQVQTIGDKTVTLGF